jgi:hypothetical protein
VEAAPRAGERLGADLNDGVRMNIRPFMEAGVLRWKPNVKWGKDRGADRSRTAPGRRNG